MGIDMFLMNKTCKGVFIKHQIVKQAKELTDEELLKQTNDLKSGQLSVVEPMVRHFIRLAVSVASRYAKRNKNTHDLVSEAITGLMQAMQEITQGKLLDDNVAAFVTARMHANISRYIKHDALVRVPYSTILQARKSEKERLGLRQQPLIFDNLYRPGRIKKTEAAQSVRESIEAAVKSDLERKVVQLRVQSYVDKEIAEMLELSTTKVHAIRERIRKRFEQLEKE